MAKARALRLVLGLGVCVAAIATGPAAAMAASISGTVTSTVDDSPIAGVVVCSRVQPFTFEETCTETNASGAYTVDGLPAGSYAIDFSGSKYNLDFVDERYDDEESWPGDLVTIGTGEARTGIDAKLRPGGRVAGTVTDADSTNPVAGFPVCAIPSEGGGRCARTEANGQYTIKGLRTNGAYRVEFLGEGEFNYLTQYWEGTEDYFDYEPVEVVEEATTSGIDAALERGAVISGTLREAGTGKPLKGIEVSLLEPGTEKALKWVQTDVAGHYAFRGRPAGTYVVAFSHARQLFEGDGFFAQYYKGAASFAAATPLTVAPPEVLTGIDGEVAPMFQPPYRETIKVTILPVPPKKPLRCKKGFRKKKVRSKPRCVKVHKRRHGKRGQGKRGQRRNVDATAGRR